MKTVRTIGEVLVITGHMMHRLGCCELFIRDDRSSYVPCKRLVAGNGSSLLGSQMIRQSN